MEACVEHTQAPGKQVYGVTTVAGQRKVGMHRLAYVRTRGLRLDDIAGLVVRHACDNKRCIFPGHLELGTQADNMRDMHERGRATKVGARGQLNGHAKLTAEEADHVRRAVGRQVDIADAFGITQATVSKIKRGATWRSI